MRLVCYPFSFNCLKGIDYSMLPWVCPVIDHRRCQNVVRTKVAFAPQASVSLMYLPHLFDIICDLLLNICTVTWNLFVKLAMERVVIFFFKKKKKKKKKRKKMSIIKMMVTKVTKCQLQNNNGDCEKN